MRNTIGAVTHSYYSFAEAVQGLHGFDGAISEMYGNDFVDAIKGFVAIRDQNMKSLQQARMNQDIYLGSISDQHSLNIITAVGSYIEQNGIIPPRARNAAIEDASKLLAERTAAKAKVNMARTLSFLLKEAGQDGGIDIKVLEKISNNLAGRSKGNVRYLDTNLRGIRNTLKELIERRQEEEAFMEFLSCQYYDMIYDTFHKHNLTLEKVKEALIRRNLEKKMELVPSLKSGAMLVSKEDRWDEEVKQVNRSYHDSVANENAVMEAVLLGAIAGFDEDGIFFSEETEEEIKLGNTVAINIDENALNGTPLKPKIALELRPPE